ncbi:uncharacterized protein LAESUDRAFT_725756 [Laetiporus sulphureus 93-53]|uniref:Integral membrane protein n=1 Tax=Laetiporus sulphureus 93-53 TaxID=1314785 RepID=A0A165EBI5_9APHY|nr:uncharacterized protein LAESUDRAFT_725756 [Laetiporus sulphureus 93-53]KZT06667.1 hypothetical protein LAESUDRAFT_725756 [Laetiporus sulphureus 93-53]
MERETTCTTITTPATNAESTSNALISPPSDDIPRLFTHPRSIHRPFPLFHPTRATFVVLTDGTSKLKSRWNSRASRKNRFALRPVQVAHFPDEAARDREKAKFAVVEQRLYHSHARLKLHLSWDVSFWVAFVFVVGSALWVINGFLLYLPLLPSPSPSYSVAASWIAFAGGTAFELGSYLMVVEALNTGHEELFGPALWGLVEEAEDDMESKYGSERAARPKKGVRGDWRRFRWIGTASWRELGYLASAIQFCAATIFWISTISGIPGIIPNLDTQPPVAITDIFFWTPQVVGGMGFFISSLLLMLEVQHAWWRPKLDSLGWHIGVWNLIGAVGFALCGALGYASATSSKANYQSVLSTFWGSWAFLIGSVIQLWETLWREDPDAIDSAGQI